jgi:hypothetical protein
LFYFAGDSLVTVFDRMALDDHVQLSGLWQGDSRWTTGPGDAFRRRPLAPFEHLPLETTSDRQVDTSESGICPIGIAPSDNGWAEGCQVTACQQMADASQNSGTHFTHWVCMLIFTDGQSAHQLVKCCPPDWPEGQDRVFNGKLSGENICIDPEPDAPRRTSELGKTQNDHAPPQG